MYFNEAQIQRMIENFPPEVKGKFGSIVLKEATPRKHDFVVPKEIVINAIKEDNIIFDGINNNIVNFYISFESLDNYNQPSEIQFKTVLEEMEEELSNTFGCKVEIKVKAISFGQPLEEVPPIYWGELDALANYLMIINIFLNSSL